MLPVGVEQGQDKTKTVGGHGKTALVQLCSSLELNLYVPCSLPRAHMRLVFGELSIRIKDSQINEDVWEEKKQGNQDFY